MKRSILLCALIFLTVFAFASCSPSDGAPQGMQTAADGSDGVILYVPSGWTVDRSLGSLYAYVSSVNTSGVILSYETAGAGDDRTAALKCADETAVLAASLTDFIEESRDETLTVDGAAACLSVYGYTVNGVSYRSESLYIRKDERFYLLTYTAETERFADNEESFSRIVTNMAFTNERADAKANGGFEDEKTPDGMILASDPRITEYRLYIPADWKIAASNDVTLVYRSDSDRSSVNVSAVTPKVTTAQEYFADYKESLKTVYADLTVLTEEESVPFGEKGEAYAVTYTGSYNGKSYKVRQYFAYHGLKLTAFTYTARTDISENGVTLYDKNLPDVEKMIAAFRYE